MNVAEFGPVPQPAPRLKKRGTTVAAECKQLLLWTGSAELLVRNDHSA